MERWGKSRRHCLIFVRSYELKYAVFALASLVYTAWLASLTYIAWLCLTPADIYIPQYTLG